VRTIVAARPRVDVGVVTYNTRDLTVRALRRLFDTDQGVDLRVLVRDNGSTDGTPDAIAREVPEADLDIGRDNVGFAAGVNRLLQGSEAPWFCTLNSDAWPLPHALAHLVETAAADERVAAVAPRLERPDGALEHSTHPFPSARVAAVLATGAYRLMPRRRLETMALEPWWRHDHAREVDWAVGAALLLRRSAVDEVGGFDERFFMYAEDLEWCWRARQLGWSVRFDPRAVVVHVGNASGGKNYGNARTVAYLRNTYRFYRREHGTAAALAYRSLNLLGAGRHWLAGRMRGDVEQAAWWREQVRGHLASTAAPDGPPVAAA
jgi:GT2 family glycosyltransferase